MTHKHTLLNPTYSKKVLTSYKLSPKGFNFDSFLEAFKALYPGKPMPSTSFLEWFIGFTEGDGSFTMAKRGDLQIVVTQSTIDIQILNYIKDSFGFGSVIPQSLGQHTHRYVIQDLNNLYLMCLLFNGNLVFPVRNFKFLEFQAALNTKLIKKSAFPPIVPDLSTVVPTLKDSWLLGFTDAEGCFTASVLKGTTAVRIRFILSQKWEINKSVLTHILDLLNEEAGAIKPLGKVVPHSNPGYFELILNGIENCNKIHWYFDTFGLKTKKGQSYNKWKILNAAFDKQEHLDPERRKVLAELSKDVNGGKFK